MTTLIPLLTVVHLVGLALGVGAATVKLVLLLRCRTDPGFVPTYFMVVKPITRQIVLGMILLTLSGAAWLVLGYGFTPLLVIKIALVAAIWILGPVIDTMVEPRFRSLAPGPGDAASSAFVSARRRYLALEFIATLCFYVIVILWVYR